VTEQPDAKATDKRATSPAGKPAIQPADKPARPWVTRAETITMLTLVFAFLVWVGVIILRQRQARRDLHWVPGQGAGSLIDLNRAEAPELMLLPGVGPSKAERIIKWRQEHGRFHSLEELHNAAGITVKDIAAMRSLVTLGVPSPEPPPSTDFAEPERE
jgi:competence ComEA-like helix-hairpin-helix protein